MTIWPELDLRRLELGLLKEMGRQTYKFSKQLDLTKAENRKMFEYCKTALSFIREAIIELDKELFIEEKGITRLPPSKPREYHVRQHKLTSNEQKALKLYKEGKHKEALQLLS